MHQPSHQQQQQQPTVPMTKGGTIDNSHTHVWGRSSLDFPTWIVIPANLEEPCFKAVTDDFGTLQKVGLQ